MPTEAQKRANYKYQKSEKYKQYKKEYMRKYYLENKEKFKKYNEYIVENEEMPIVRKKSSTNRISS
jgi:hypothetical protein